MAALADLVFSSKVESLVADVQEKGALIIIQEFLVPAADDGHQQLVVGGNLHAVLPPFPNLEEGFCPRIGIVGKKTEGETWTGKR
jgi:hypothetical protein